MKLYITTLGVFDIKLEDTTLIKDSSRSYRLYKLLQYFITFKNKKILADTIIENIWPDHESYDPYNMLRAQIFRLRQLIKKSIPEGEDEKLYMTINFSNGYYSLEVGDKVIVDTDEFERLIHLGDENIIDDIDNTVKYYEKALEIYKGSYLEDNAYEVWLVPIKNYYSSLYTKTLFKLLEILNYQEDYLKIKKICRDSITHEPQNEKVHIQLMEAMLKLDKIKDAQSHYEYFSFLLNKNKIINPSLALQDIGNKIQNRLHEKNNTNIRSIRLKLDEEKDKGPLLCEFNYFRFIFNLQKRKRNKVEEPDYISLVTLNDESNQLKLEKWTEDISEVLKNSLRQGDVFTFWNESQILILTQNVQNDGISLIENRIKNNLNKLGKDYNITIKSTSIVSETVLV